MSTGRTWLWWHSWIGVTTGLLLFVICWSGTVAVFSHEIDWLLNPALRVEARADAPPRWEETIAAAGRAVPGHRITHFKLPERPGDAAELFGRSPDGTMVRVYADPSTAHVTGTTSYFNVQRFFRSFHMNLFYNTGPWGYFVVCAFALPLLASALTALFFYRRWWQRWWVLKWNRGAAVFWSDLHKTGGLWSLWFVLVMGVTGVWYFVEIAGVDLDYPPEPEFRQSAAGAALPMDTLLQQARAAWPALEPRNVYLPGGFWGDTVRVDGLAGDLLVRERANKLFLDPRTGAVQAQQRAADLPLAARWVDTADPLHFGNFAGWPVKLLWFVFGLLLSGLVLMGAYLHVERQRRKRQGPSRRAVVTATYLVSALVLGAAVVGGWVEIRRYGPVVDGVRQWPQVLPQVIAFIAAWVVLTLAILAAWVRKLR